MNRLGVLMTVLCILFLFHVNAQNTPESDAGVLHPLHPTLALVIGILAVMFSLTFILLAYAKFCKATQLDAFNHNTLDQNFHGLIRSRSRFSGIDRTVIDSLPFFRFSSLKGSKEGLECAVCISKFEDTEILRLLPKCRHAFHINCIDQWLESHSSCPICRYKFDTRDLKSFTYTNSSRFLQNPFNLTEDPNLEIFVQREQDHQGSSRFNIGSSFRSNNKGKKEELLIQEGDGSDGDRKLLHKFKHKIVISDVVIKNRWSDVNSSDLLFLNSEMLSALSSNRFSSSESNSARFQNVLSKNEQMVKIKEDIERKRTYESKFNRIDRNHSVSASGIASTSYNERYSSKTLNPAEKRSMSEITNVSRFVEFSIKSKMKEAGLGGDTGKEERIRRIWFPIARRTVQWLASREKNSKEPQYKQQILDV